MFPFGRNKMETYKQRRRRGLMLWKKIGVGTWQLKANRQNVPANIIWAICKASHRCYIYESFLRRLSDSLQGVIHWSMLFVSLQSFSWNFLRLHGGIFYASSLAIPMERLFADNWKSIAEGTAKVKGLSGSTVLEGNLDVWEGVCEHLILHSETDTFVVSFGYSFKSFQVFQSLRDNTFS